jgi:hypothetical protein
MCLIRRWEQNATAITCTGARTERLRVRELRQACGDSDARETKEKSGTNKETAEAEQAKILTFSLSASLAFGSLSLFAFSGESVTGEATASNLRTNYREAIRISKLAPVIAKALLIEVSEQVERLHADICAVKLPFHERPEVFHSIRVDVSLGVLDRVIYYLMAVIFGQSIIGFQRVAEQRGTNSDVLADVTMEFMFTARGNRECENFAATLHHSKSDSLILSARSGNDLPPPGAVHVPRFATNERFVNFHFSGQLRSGLVLHRLSNPMQQEPSRLLSDSQITGHLAGANAILAVRNHPHRHQPLIQWDRRLIQNGSYLDGELLAAICSLALPNTAGLEEHWFLSTAVWTLHALGPALGRKIVQSVVRIVEVNNRFGQCFRGFHEQSMA